MTKYIDYSDPQNAIDPREATYNSECECGFEGEVEGMEAPYGEGMTVFSWECPRCGTSNETYMDWTYDGD